MTKLVLGALLWLKKYLLLSVTIDSSHLNVFSASYSVLDRKYWPFWVLISDSTTVLSLSFSREKKKNVHPIRASLHIFLRLFCKDFAHFCNAFFLLLQPHNSFRLLASVRICSTAKNLFALGCSSLKYWSLQTTFDISSKEEKKHTPLQIWLAVLIFKAEEGLIFYEICHDSFAKS